MPIDQWGNRVDVAIFGGSTMRRSNYGRLYEQGFGAAARDLIQRLRTEKGLDRHDKPTEAQLQEVLRDKEWIQYAYDELLGLYSIIAPSMNRILAIDPDPAGHVYHSLRDQFYLYMPVDEQFSFMEATNKLMASKYRPNFGPVTYRDDAGKVVTTVNNVLTGPLYMILLEKIGEDWSAVASVKTQPFGLPSKLNNSDRSSTPGRETAIRSYGESETRSYNSVVGEEATNELIDQTNNPLAHAAVVRSILQATAPSNIERAVNREEVPYGGSRPVVFFHHLLMTRGLKLVNSDCEPGQAA